MFPNAAGVDFVEVMNDEVNVAFSPFPYIYNLLEGGSGDSQPVKMFSLVLSTVDELASVDPELDTAIITLSCKWHGQLP